MCQLVTQDHLAPGAGGMMQEEKEEEEEVCMM